MKISAICVTYMRPRQLGMLIRCFQEQDYPADQCELVILDDAGQYDDQSGDRWRLVSTPERYSTLGEKRNAAVALASPDAEAFAVWDDDDFYLPWALRASAAALEIAPWSRPSVVHHFEGGNRLKQHFTGGLYHGGWAYRRSAFESVGGYPAINNGEDQAIARRFSEAGVAQSDPCTLGFPPFYVYSWGKRWHLSGMGPDGYDRLGRLKVDKTPLVIRDPAGLDLHEPMILPGVHARMF